MQNPKRYGHSVLTNYKKSSKYALTERSKINYIRNNRFPKSELVDQCRIRRKRVETTSSRRIGKNNLVYP